MSHRGRGGPPTHQRFHHRGGAGRGRGGGRGNKRPRVEQGGEHIYYSKTWVQNPWARLENRSSFTTEPPAALASSRDENEIELNNDDDGAPATATGECPQANPDEINIDDV